MATVVALGSTAAAAPLRDVGNSSARVPSQQSQVSRPASASRANGIGIIRLGDTFPQASGYGRYGYVIVGRGDAAKVARFRGTSLVYMSGTDIAPFNTGVSMSEASAHNWLLRGADGNLVGHDDYENVYLADVGSPAYQRAWVSNVLAFLHATRVRGVFIDDVMADPRTWTIGDVFPTAYPDQPSWAAAMTSFVRTVGTALKAHGYYVLVSAGGRVRDAPGADSGQADASFWRTLAPSVSGLLNEYWLQNPNDNGQLRSVGGAWYQQWRGWERLVSVAQAAGVDFLGLTYGTSDDLQAMRFGRGSFLLDWNGRGGAFIYETPDGDPYNPAWTTDLGRPLDRKAELAPGVWRRRYDRGSVIVNATPAPVTVNVDGAPRTIQATDALFLYGR